MGWYLTEYMDPINGARYGSHVWAASLDAARRKARQRGIGEKVLGESAGRFTGDEKKRIPGDPFQRPSVMVKSRKPMTVKRRMDIIHGTTFLCYLLASCRNPPAHRILGDTGILHETVHCLMAGSPSRASLAEMLAKMEARVPGYVRA